MKKNGIFTILISLLIGAAIGIGVITLDQNDEINNIDESNVNKETKEYHSFWTSTSPDQWRTALMKPSEHPSPNAYPATDVPIILDNLELVLELMQDDELPTASRWQLTTAVYGLSLLEIVMKEKQMPLKEERDKKIFKASILALKTRYQMANEIDPIEGLVSVNYAVGLASKGHDPDESKKILNEYGWDLPEKVIVDAIALSNN